MEINKRAEVSKMTIAVIVTVLTLLVAYGLISTFSHGSLSTVGANGGTCSQFTDVNGNTYSSFDKMRAQNADLATVTNAQLQLNGLKETTSGVQLCN